MLFRPGDVPISAVAERRMLCRGYVLKSPKFAERSQSNRTSWAKEATLGRTSPVRLMSFLF